MNPRAIPFSLSLTHKYSLAPPNIDLTRMPFRGSRQVIDILKDIASASGVPIFAPILTGFLSAAAKVVQNVEVTHSQLGASYVELTDIIMLGEEE